MIHWTRVSLLLLALALTASPALAQNPPPEQPPAGEEEGSGRSGDGYIATGVLIGIALFAVCKTARRS